MSCVDINELNIAPELVFSNVACFFKEGRTILGDSGSVVYKRDNTFAYRAFNGAPNISFKGDTEVISNYYDFEIKDAEQCGLVLNYLRKGYVCLAQIASKAAPKASSSLKCNVSLTLAFFIKGRMVVELSILVSDKVKKNLLKRNYLKEDSDLNEILSDNFTLSDGVGKRGCFAYLQHYFNDEENEYDTLNEDKTNISNNSTDEDVIGIEGLNDNFGENKPIEYNAEKNDKSNSIVDDLDTETATPVVKNRVEETGFILFGKAFNLGVVLVESDEGKRYFAKRIMPRGQKPSKMMLGSGKLLFTDNAELIQQGIQELFSSSGEYVKTWEAYTNMEGEFLLKRARAINVLRLEKNHSVTINESGNIRLMLHESARGALYLLNLNDRLDCFEELPSYLQDFNLTWNEYKSGVKNIDSDPDAKNGLTEHLEPIFTKSAAINEKPLEIEKIDIANCSIILKTTQCPKGHLVLSLRGYEMQIKRREEARECIMKGDGPNPRIAGIIANNIDVNAPGLSGGVVDENIKVPALSSLVMKKIFPNPAQPPTSTQEEAIGIALNTPDIAIIQGPPGTGKTTVITAILERLNELSDKKNLNSGRVLITSLQHDAVNNVIERIRINSLPTIKYGRKLNYEESIEGSVELWCDQLVDNLLDRNPELKKSSAEQLLANSFCQYILTPDHDQATHFLKEMMSIALDTQIKEEISLLLDKLNETNSIGPEYLLPLIRRLRVTGKSFMDDGPSNAGDLYIALEEIFSEDNKQQSEILHTLRDAFALNVLSRDDLRRHLKQNNMALLKRLDTVKQTLLEMCVPKPINNILEPREDIVDLYKRVKLSLRASGDTVNGILNDLLSELENNQLEVRNAVSQYSYAFAATAQQSEGKAIKSAKKINDKEHPEYDTVIVDEAARVNPGDLMVPLCQAKDRIILVGDHRQLPHMYDQEIFDTLIEKGIHVQEEDVKLSLFQQLLEKAKVLEKIDGRKRYITLDKQYRTHPLLGNFVSDEFYKPNGEGYTSPLPAELFQQEHFAKPLVWIDIPYEAGNEQRSGTSRLRVREAQIISDRIATCVEKDEKKIQEELLKEKIKLQDQNMNYEQMQSAIERTKRELERKQYSYGVITFYSAQVEAIKKELKNKLRYKFDDLVKRQKLRIGSVDAFQGMEFDMIFLSVVRTGKKPIDFDPNRDTKLLVPAEKATDEIRLKQDRIAAVNYGFLTSQNRMCVAMSRQKKVLVVVGDANIFSGEKYKELAERFVPGMKHLYELSEREGVIEYDR